MVYAQLSGAPPVFAGSSVLHNTDALNSFIKKVNAITDTSRPLQVLYLGDSHVKSGFLAEAFADSLNRYFNQAKNRGVIQLTTMAKDGATSKHFLEDVYQAATVQTLQPDLIIISLGTNEAQNLYTLNDLQIYFTRLLAQIRSDAPDSPVLFTTPGDALRKTTRQVKKRKRYYTVASLAPNAVLPMVTEFIKDLAEENEAAYWDWYKVMGGRGAVVRWAGHGYANTDHIHLTEKGYNLQGWLLATAFITFFKTVTDR